MSTDNTARRTLRYGEVIQISQIIGAHYHKNALGDWAWDAGWSDEKVLAECKIPGATAYHVTRIREAGFGKLKKEPKSEHGRLSQRIKELEARIVALEAIVTAPAKPQHAHVNGPGRSPTPVRNY